MPRAEEQDGLFPLGKPTNVCGHQKLTASVQNPHDTLSRRVGSENHVITLRHEYRGSLDLHHANFQNV